MSIVDGAKHVRPRSWNGQTGILGVCPIAKISPPRLDLDLLFSTPVAFLPGRQHGARYEDAVADYLRQIEGKARQQSTSSPGRGGQRWLT